MEPELTRSKENDNYEVENTEISKNDANVPTVPITDSPTQPVDNQLLTENDQLQINAVNDSITAPLKAVSQTAPVNNESSSALVTDTFLSDEIGTSDVENKVEIEEGERETPVTESENPEIDHEEVSVEEEEEYEEDEVDEEGKINVVVKKRIVRVKKLIVKPIAQDETIKDKKETELDVEIEKGVTDIEEETEYEEKEEEEEEVEEEEWVEEEEIIEEEEDLEEGSTKVIEKRRKIKKRLSDLSTDEVIEEEEKPVRHEKRKKKKLKKRKKETVDEEEKEKDDEDKPSEEKESSVKSEPSAVESVTEEEFERELTEEELELKQLQKVYTDLKAEHREVKYKEIFLKKKLFRYFKSKKIDHAISHSKGTPEVQNQYLMKLYSYEKAQKKTLEKKKELMTKWDEIKGWNLAAKMRLEEAMNNLYEIEKQIGTKLVDTKTGKSMPDKFQEDLKSRQLLLNEEITKVHLQHIKLKNKVATKKAEIKMDHMGSDFRLMDYEQLCIDKEDYVDRIIDRDYELKKVNQKTKDMQEFVDHMKEVSDTLQNKIDNETFTLERLDQYLSQAREGLNALKDKRHSTIEEIFRMKKASGLLTQPALLYDFEDTVKALSELSLHLDELKKLFRRQERNILRLRSSFEKKKR